MFEDTDWQATIKAMCPKGRSEIISGFAAAMPDVIDRAELTTPLRVCHFLAQVCHESGGLRFVREIWGPTPAQTRYEGRKDLGNTRKGDGKRFMGRALIQTTGRSNYFKVSKALGIDFVAKPELLEKFPAAADSAAVFWIQNRVNARADADDCRGCTKIVNGGLNGFSERQTYLARAKTLLLPKADRTDEIFAAAVEEIMPVAKIRILQGRLDALGYHCVADGQIGGATVGAIASFQHDNALDSTNKFDKATEAALYEAEARPVSASRSLGAPDSSRIMQGASALQKGALGIMGTVGVKAAADPLATLAGVNGYYDQVKSSLASFGLTPDLIANNWMLIVGLLGAAVFAYAHSIQKARIEDHQTGKTT